MPSTMSECASDTDTRMFVSRGFVEAMRWALDNHLVGLRLTVGEIAHHSRQHHLASVSLKSARHRDADPALRLGILPPSEMKSL